MGEQMRLGSGIFLNGPSILPAEISLSKCCCSSLGCWNADFKFLWILPCLGPLYLSWKPWQKPVKTSCINTWLGWPCSSASSLSGLTAVYCRTSCISCWSWSPSSLLLDGLVLHICYICVGICIGFWCTYPCCSQNRHENYLAVDCLPCPK